MAATAVGQEESVENITGNDRSSAKADPGDFMKMVSAWPAGMPASRFSNNHHWRVECRKDKDVPKASQGK